MISSKTQQQQRRRSTSAQTRQADRQAILDRAIHPCVESLEGRRLLSVGAANFGPLDATVVKGFQFDYRNGIVSQTDGKILVAGYVNNGGTGHDVAVARYNVNGTLDTTYGSGGVAVLALSGSQEGKGIALDPSGRATVAVKANNGAVYGFAVARFTTSGAVDTTFDSDGYAQVNFGSGNENAAAIAVRPTGEIVVGGAAQISSSPSARYDFAIAQFTSAGALDSSFDGDGKLTNNAISGNSDQITDMSIQPDGKVVVAGSSAVTGGGDGTAFVVKRFAANGGSGDAGFSGGNAIVTTFGAGTVAGASGITVQSDGKIVASGSVTSTSSGDVNFGVARYTSAGVLDTTFNGTGKTTLNFGSTDIPGSIAMQTLGGTQKIVVAGSSGSHGDIAVARLNLNGSLDTSFDTDGKATYAYGDPDTDPNSGVERVPGLAIQTLTGPFRSNILTAGVNTADGLILTSVDGNTATLDTVWVDDNWTVTTDVGPAGVSTGDTVTSHGVTATFGVDAFATIQNGINAVNANGTVRVFDGTFKENPTVNKSVSLIGDNAGTAGSGGRASESIIVTNGAQDRVVTVSAANVTIDGFTVDGDDPSTITGNTFSGDDSNAARGIRGIAGTSNLIVRNDIIKKVGIGVYGDVASQGNVITNNWFDRIGNFDFGYGVSIRNNFYANVTNNLMTKVWTGVHINNHNGGSGPASFNITGNEIHDYAGGILYWLQFNGATGATISGNTITTEAAAVAGNYGLFMVSIQNAVNPSITSNTITGADIGVAAWNTPTTSTITLGPTNSVVGSKQIGVLLSNNIPNTNPIGTTVLGGGGAAATLNLAGMPISTASGEGVKIDASGGTVQTMNITGTTITGAPGSTKGVDVANANAVAVIDGSPDENVISGFAAGISSAGSVTITDNDASITGNVVGIDVTAGNAVITGNHIYDNGTGIRLKTGGTATVSNNNFVGPADNGTDIRLDSDAGALTFGNGNALAGNTYFIDNQSAQNFDLTTNTSTFDEVSNFRIEDKLFHKPDATASGLIRVVANNIFVTAPGTGASNETIQRGVTAAAAGDTVNVEAGTFNENVTATQSVHLVGAQAGVDARGRVASETIWTPAVATTAQLTISFNGLITVDGFSFSGGSSGTQGCIFTNVGPNNGMQIVNNRFSNYSTAAVWLNRGGADITIDKNVMDGSNLDSGGTNQTIFLNGGQSYNGLWLTNNDIINNKHRYGLFVDGNHNVSESATRAPLIDFNTFDNNLQGLNLGSRSFGTLGAPVLGAYGGTISNNFFTNNAANGIQAGIQHVHVYRNDFSNNALSGLALTSFGNTGADRGAQNSFIDENFFDNNGTEGVFFSATQAANTISTNVLFHNSLTPANKTAVTYNGTETIDARGNWFASVNGPTSPANGFNVGSQGSTVGGTGAAHVLIAPWLTDGTDTQPGTRGFQPNAGSSFAPIYNDQGGFFSTFQAANNGTTAGGTITATNGNYNESNILIDRGVTIQGQSRAGVILGPAIADGHVNDNFTSASNGFIVGSSNVTIKDMTIDGNADGAIAGTQNYRNAILTNYNVGDYGNVDVDNVTISNIFRKGVGFYVVDNNKVTGDSVTNSSFDHIGGTGVTFEATFAIAAFQSDTDISNVQITTSAAGIGTNYFTTDANSPVVHISNTTVSNMTGLAGIPVVGMDLSGLANGSSVTGGGVDVSGAGSSQADRGIVVQYTATNADVTVSGVTVTTGGGSNSDTGIMVYQAKQAAHPVVLSNNILVGNGAANGIDVTDDGSFFGESPNVGITYAKLVGNNVSGFTNGSGVSVNDHGGTAVATIGLAGVGNGNTLTGNSNGITVAGGAATITNNSVTSVSGDGIQVTDAGSATADGNTLAGSGGSNDGVNVNGASSANVLNNIISGFDTGVEVDGAGTSADIGGGNNITAVSTGVSVSGGASANIHDNLGSIHDVPTGIAWSSGSGSITNNHIYNTTVDIDVTGGTPSITNNNLGAATTDQLRTSVNGLTITGNSFVDPMPTNGKRFDGVGTSYNIPALYAANTWDTAVDVRDGSNVYQQAEWANIQGGINAASAGNFVHAHHGTYNEQAFVNKTLTIEGDNVGTAGTAARVTESIVRGAFNGSQRSTAFNITANDVVIDGFTVRDTNNPNQFGPAILINVGTHGTRITDNIITNNVWGISLANNSAVDATRIDHNWIHDNSLPGPNSGQGIYADQFTSGANFQNVQIDHNTVAEPTGNAVDFSGSGAGWANNITVDTNTLSSDGTVIYSQDMSNFTVTNNTITVGTFRGIAVFDGGVGVGGGSGLNISNNAVNANAANVTGNRYMIQLEIAGGANTVNGNAVTMTGTLSATTTTGGISVDGSNSGSVNFNNNNIQGGGALGGTTQAINIQDMPLVNLSGNTLLGWTSGGSLSNDTKVNWTQTNNADTFVITTTTMQDNANQAVTYTAVPTLDVFTLGNDDLVTATPASGLTVWVDAGAGTNDTVSWESAGSGADDVQFITAPTVGPDISATESVYRTGNTARVNIANAETRRIRTFGGDDAITYVRLGGSLATGFTIESGDNNDNVLGGLGNDTILGGDGDDRIDAANGNDSVLGEGGNDTMFGGVGNDLLDVGSGENQAFGQNGNDTIHAQNGGLDFVDGGAGFDTGKVDGIDLTSSLESLI